MQTEDNGQRLHSGQYKLPTFVGLSLRWFWSVRKLDIGMKTDETAKKDKHDMKTDETAKKDKHDMK